MTKEELLEKMAIWKEQHGIPTVSKTKFQKHYQQIPYGQRKPLFQILIRELIDCSIPKEYFTTYIKNVIVEDITAKKCKNRSETLVIAKKDLDDAIAIEYHKTSKNAKIIEKPVEKRVLVSEEPLSSEEASELDIEYDDEMSDFLGYKKDE